MEPCSGFVQSFNDNVDKRWRNSPDKSKEGRAKDQRDKPDDNENVAGQNNQVDDEDVK